MSSRSVAAVGMFAALVAALGFLLSGVPNVEFMTLGTFVSGALLGPVRGAAVGAVAMAIYSSFNPYGAGLAFPLIFAMQVSATAGIGAVGGVLDRISRTAGLGIAGSVAAGGVVGLALTLVYFLLTNLGVAWSTGMDVGAVLAGGLTFGIWHMVSNAVLFAVAGPPLLAALRRRRTGAL